jgi:hypothetical protein
MSVFVCVCLCACVCVCVCCPLSACRSQCHRNPVCFSIHRTAFVHCHYLIEPGQWPEIRSGRQEGRRGARGGPCCL